MWNGAAASPTNGQGGVLVLSRGYQTRSHPKPKKAVNLALDGRAISWSLSRHEMEAGPCAYATALEQIFAAPHTVNPFSFTHLARSRNAIPAYIATHNSAPKVKRRSGGGGTELEARALYVRPSLPRQARLARLFSTGPRTSHHWK